MNWDYGKGIHTTFVPDSEILAVKSKHKKPNRQEPFSQSVKNDPRKYWVRSHTLDRKGYWLFRTDDKTEATEKFNKDVETGSLRRVSLGTTKNGRNYSMKEWKR